MQTFIIDGIGVISSAGALFLVSAGLTLVFGAMRLINIAHGSLYMYGAFLATTFLGAGSGLRFVWALVAGTVVVGALGGAMEVAFLRRIYGKEHLTQLLVTFALFLILADLALHFWGTASRTVSPPAVVAGQVAIGGATFPAYDLVVIGAAAIVGAGLWLLLQRTSFGWRIRAAVEDPESVQTGGTNLARLRTGVFVLGAALAGFAGALVSPQVAVAPGMDEAIVVSAFIVAVVGGLGSVAGAALGSLIIGAAETIGTIVLPNWSSTFMYLSMVVVLAVRPWGLFGVPER